MILIVSIVLLIISICIFFKIKVKKNVYILLITNMFVLTFFNFVHAVTPEIIQINNLSNSSSGFLYSAMSIGMVIGSSFWAMKSQKIGLKKVMIIGVIGYGVCLQVYAFSGNLPIMFISRVLSGICASAWIVTSFQYLNKISSSNKKAINFSYLLVTNALGAVIGQQSSAYLSIKYNIYIPFIIHLIGLIIVAIFIQKLFEKIDVDIKNKKKIKFKNVLNLKATLLLLVSLFLSIALTSYMSEVGYYVYDILGGTNQMVASVNNYNSVITIVVNLFLIQFMHKYFSKKQSIYLIICTSMIGVFLIKSLVLGGITIFLFGIAAYRPTIQKLIIDNFPNKNNEILGIENSFNSIGMALGGFLSGMIYNINPNLVIIFIFTILIIAICLFIFFNLIKENNERI